jgi:hypothetical protein
MHKTFKLELAVVAAMLAASTVSPAFATPSPFPVSSSMFFYGTGFMQAADGNFYGTDQVGDFFKVTPTGTLTTIATFGGNQDDQFVQPVGIPVQDLIDVRST